MQGRSMEIVKREEGVVKKRLNRKDAKPVRKLEN